MYHQNMLQQQHGNVLEGPMSQEFSARWQGQPPIAYDYRQALSGSSSSSSAQPAPTGQPTSFAPAHSTDKHVFNTVKEWTDHSKNKAYLLDQLQLREGWADDDDDDPDRACL